MRKTSKIVALLPLLVTAGCMGRGMTVRDAKVENASRIQGQKIERVYFRPFDLAGVELKGDHGKTSVAEENKIKWFTHVLVGAQLEFKKSASGMNAVLAKDSSNAYDREIFQKTKLDVPVNGKIPADAVVISGKYLFSENVSGASRAFLGMMSGKSWTRAEVTVKRGKDLIYSSKLDGKYMGGGFSWGYETLGANEGLGAGIAQIVEKLQKGEPISSK